MRDKTIFSMVTAAVIAVAAAVPLSVAAYDFVEDGIYYNFNENRTEVAVTYKASKTASYSGEVAIPERVVHNGVTYPVTAIAGGAFSYSNNLTAVEIPNTVRSIGDHAFANCTALQGIVIPNSVESLGRCVFHTCSAMTSAVVGNSVPVIDEYCFQYCYSLNDVVIGTSVEFLAIKAFFDCPNIRKVTCLATTPPSMNASYSLSNEAYQNATLCVPGSAMAAYKADTNWGRFRTFVNITMATSLTLDCTSLSLKSGAQHQFVASVMPADASPAVRWSTSDNEVAVVDQNGMVTAMGAGQATITATTPTDITPTGSGSDGSVTFKGTFGPHDIGGTDGDNTKLYLGNGNKLYWPSGAKSINAFRAYFQLNNGITAGNQPNSGVRAFVLNFDGDEETGIATTNYTDSTDSDNAWYDLSGRKLSGKPTTKGLYINNGKKVVIK